MKGMSIIVKTISSWVKILIFLFGLYIILFGHLSPGGGFAGGVILASSYVLLMLAFGRECVEKDLPINVDSKLDSIGILLYAFIGVLGFVFGGTFFLNFLLQEEMLPGEAQRLVSAGTIPLLNIAIGLKVGASLFLGVFTLAVFRQDVSKGKEPPATKEAF
ncbi:MnhB domain-containing protein [Planctomycetota bacterium]